MSYYFKGLERQVTIQETKMASTLSFTKNLNHNFGGDVNGIAHLDPDFLRCRYRCRCCSRCSTQGLFGLTRRQVVKVTGILGNHSSKSGWCKSSILLEWFWVFQNVFTTGSLSISISWQKKDYVFRHSEVDLRKCVKVNVSYMLSKFSMYYSTSKDVHTA